MAVAAALHETDHKRLKPARGLLRRSRWALLPLSSCPPYGENMKIIVIGPKACVAAAQGKHNGETLDPETFT